MISGRKSNTRGSTSCQSAQILGVLSAVRQLHVDPAALFAKREVAGAVHRERQHLGIVFEDQRRAVALVHIQIHHRRAQARMRGWRWQYR